MYNEATFDLEVLNSKLVKQVPALQKITAVRKQLTYMKDFINSCRDKEKLLVDIKDKQHLINDINFFFSWRFGCYCERQVVGFSQETV